MIEDYLDEFQTLISEASYTNSYTIIIKFYYKLWIAVYNQITILLVKRLFYITFDYSSEFVSNFSI